MKKITILIITCLITSVMFSQNYKFGKISKEELSEKKYVKDSTANAAYLYKYRRTYFEYLKEEGFRVITEVKMRIKIYNKNGFDYANQQISYYNPEAGRSKEKVTSIKAYTYNLVNNKIEKSKLSKKGIFNEKKNKYYSIKKLTMPNIKEGSVIDFQYTLTSPFFEIDELKYQYEIPIKKLIYTVEMPEYFVFKRNMKGYYFIEPEEKVGKGRIFYTSTSRMTIGSGKVTKRGQQETRIEYLKTTHSYVKEDIPALRDNEPFVSNIQNYRGGVKYELKLIKMPNSLPKYYSDTWDDVSKKIYQSSNFGGQLEKKNYFDKDISPIIASAKSEVEKTIAIFEFVKSKVKWNGYNGKYSEKGVKKAYNDGVGNSADINLLLTSMLQFAGLNSNPVLVSTRSQGVPLFPTLDGFNYVISTVEFSNGNTVLLDATDPYSLPNLLPVRAINWEGRLVKKDGTSFAINLMPKKHSVRDNNLNVKISSDGSIEGLMRTKMTNYEAYNYRKKYNHVKNEGVIAKLEEEYKIEIENSRVTNDKNLNKPISRIIKFSSEDLTEGINGKLYVTPLLFLANINNVFKLEDRKYPVDFVNPWKNKVTVSIQIPEGYKTASIPEMKAISMSNNLGVFKYQINQVENKIKILSVVQFNSAIITPEYYKELKEFYNQMVKKQTEKIVLVKQ